MKKRKVAAMFCSAVLACSLISGCSGLGSDEPVSKTETKEEKTEAASYTHLNLRPRNLLRGYGHFVQISGI